MFLQIICHPDVAFAPDRLRVRWTRGSLSNCGNLQAALESGGEQAGDQASESKRGYFDEPAGIRIPSGRPFELGGLLGRHGLFRAGQLPER